MDLANLGNNPDMEYLYPSNDLYEDSFVGHLLEMRNVTPMLQNSSASGTDSTLSTTSSLEYFENDFNTSSNSSLNGSYTGGKHYIKTGKTSCIRPVAHKI